VIHHSGPPVPELDVFITDLNGHLRGKRIPARSAPKILQEGFKLPLSAIALDYWGNDVPANGLVFETGDSDGICLPTHAQPLSIPWVAGEHRQLMCMMHNADETPFHVDPRQLLMRVVERYRKHGWTPVVATEMEFYVLDPAHMPNSENPPPELLDWASAYCIETLDTQRDFLSDMYQACEIQDIPIDACISELGDGQFECNLKHVPDPVLAADHAILFKRLVKGVATMHKQHASFMAKPFGERSGNGFHLHFSLLDAQGRNLFDDGTDAGSPLLRHAIAGLLALMSDSTLIFAPGLNSYRRLVPGSHAPIYTTWGYENRTVAVRVPESPGDARRIEHRVAGADANPYLVIASILAAALHGMEQQLEPPAPTEGDGYSEHEEHECLPHEWSMALERFRSSKPLADLLDPQFVEVFAAVKEQEYLRFASIISEAEYETYL